MGAALCCSHFFSASETAFFSLKKIDLIALQRSDSRHSKAVIALLKRPDDLLVTVLLGNMVVNVFYASLSVLVAHELGGPNLSAALAVELSALAILIIYRLPRSPRWRI